MRRAETIRDPLCNLIFSKIQIISHNIVKSRALCSRFVNLEIEGSCRREPGRLISGIIECRKMNRQQVIVRLAGKILTGNYRDTLYVTRS